MFPRGGLDMQCLMPYGSPEDVRREAERYMRALAPGYILDYANILHEDIPPANSVALYTADRNRKQGRGVPATEAERPPASDGPAGRK